MKKNKVLQFICEPISNGGEEAFVMNMFRNINNDMYIFDLYTPYYCDNENYKTEVKRLGGKLFDFKNSFNSKTKTKVLYTQTKKFLNENKYQIIHIHSGSILSLLIASYLARKSGAEKVIVHSHCGGTKSIKYRIIKLLSTPFMLKFPTDYLACSKLAAEWKFPRKILNKVKIINNGIVLDKFSFSNTSRNLIREKFGLNDKFVIGHVGRFEHQKNHAFLIDIFNEVYKNNKNAVLLLIGVGPLEEEIKEKVKNLKLEKNVLFLGSRNNVNEFYQAMDIFVLPSLYEGLPIVSIEAQTSGLRNVISTTISEETDVTGNVEFISLETSAKEWAKSILKNETSDRTREQSTINVKKSNYDIKDAVKQLEKVYKI